MQHHLAPNGKSRLTFKNALTNESKSIFSGLIKVENEAQQTNSYQTNRNLLLSNETEADSMPGLWRFLPTRSNAVMARPRAR